MQARSSSRPLAASQRRSLAPLNCRRHTVCRADGKPGNGAPQWVPQAAAPFLKFLESDNVKVKDLPGYQQYLSKVLEDNVLSQAVGWNRLPETINGRAAMIGFFAAAGAEIFGAGSVLVQLSKAPQVFLLVLALITVGSVVPIYKGTKGDYLASVRDTYAVPEGWFTENREKVHGRLAMVGLATLIFMELVLGKSLL